MEKLKRILKSRQVIIGAVCVTVILIALGTKAMAERRLAQSAAIGAENAKNFAFADAGVDPAAAERAEAEFDYEQGEFVYDVEFYYGGVEYEYLIRASDGAVVEKRLRPGSGNGMNIAPEAGSQAPEQRQPEATPVPEERSQSAEQKQPEEAAVPEVRSQSAEQKQPEAPPVPEERSQSAEQKQPEEAAVPEAGSQAPAQKIPDAAPGQGGISLEEAKNIALSDAGVSADSATFTKGKQDCDDGILVYDVEFYDASYEYDYEISAADGRVLGREQEPLKAGNSGTSNYIGIDQAKSIAVRHAGFEFSEVTFSKAKLDHDDGYTVYEIEFYKDRNEYEYTVNALTGDIIEFDQD